MWFGSPDLSLGQFPGTRSGADFVYTQASTKGQMTDAEYHNYRVVEQDGGIHGSLQRQVWSLRIPGTDHDTISHGSDHIPFPLH